MRSNIKINRVFKGFARVFSVYSLILGLLSTAPVSPVRAKDAGTRFFAEVEMEYTDNVFGLTDSQKDKLRENSAQDTTRFSGMESISDLIFSPGIGLKSDLGESNDLKLTGYVKYNYYSKNTDASFPEAGFRLKKEIGRNDELEFRSELIFDRFKKNYLSGVNDSNSNGNITRSERLYAAASYDDYDSTLSYRHLIHRDKSAFVTKTFVTPFVGYRTRNYNSVFDNRSYDLPYGGLEFAMNFQPGFDIRIKYEYGKLDSAVGQELFLYDEILTGIDANSDGVLKENAAVTSQVDRSCSRQSFSIASTAKLSDVTTLCLEYENRTDDYSTTNTMDVKRYNGDGYERKFKAGLKFRHSHDWSSEIEYGREHDKDSDGDEYYENSYVFCVKKKL